MLIKIEKNKMRRTRNHCSKCKKFIFETDEQGYLHLRKDLKISTNGTEINIKCTCGEMIKIVLN